MPTGLGQATQMIGPIAPALLCWACLIIVVVGLALMFFWTNVTAFARQIRGGQRKPTAGSMPESKSSR